MSEVQCQHGGGQAGHPGGMCGGDGQSFSSMLSSGGDSPQHNFISHLLGLDHDAHLHSGGHDAGGGELPSQSVEWNSALQSISLSDALAGIKPSPQFLFICMFFCFIMWLFVIYWVRHHEPLANGVLGTAAAHCSTSAADRRILDGTKYAFPGRTCEAMGDIYVPSPADAVQPGAAQAQSPYQSITSMPLPIPPVPPPPAPEPKPVPLQAAGYYPAPVMFQPAYGQAQAAPAYFVPEAESGGQRLRMIVNR